MKFSIVTISFNQARFLERTIESVLSQAGPGIEIEYIVVDPGSTDGSRDIIERYRDRISTIVFERDRGAADGLNNGFAHASGEIYGYLNSDDTLEPHALQMVSEFFSRRSDVGVVSGHGWAIDASDKRLRKVWSNAFHRVSAAYGASVQVQPSTFIRRDDFLKTGGFNVGNRCTWDGELMVDLYMAGSKFGIMNAFLSTYRLHEGTVTLSHSLQECTDRFMVQRFETLLGRPYSKRDKLTQAAMRLLKHATSPRATFERIVRGPIYRRKLT